jgi:hypothetical protein
VGRGHEQLARLDERTGEAIHPLQEERDPMRASHS